MSNYGLDWDGLGQNIQDIIDRAISSQDYQKLSQTIRKTVDSAVERGSEAVRRALDGSRTETRPVVVEEKKPAPVLYAGTGGKTALGILKCVGGSVFAGVMLISWIVCGIVSLLEWASAPLLFPMILAMLGCVAGSALFFNGVHALGLVSRFKTYRRILGEKTYCSLEKLAQSVGKSIKYVRKELRKMIQKGFFLEGHLDKEETLLITSHETYQYFEQSRLQLEERRRLEAAEAKKAAEAPKTAAEDPQVREVLDRGNAFLVEIRKCNDAIPGQEISDKIYRMEWIVQRIFERAAAHPEIVPDLKKLMNYYLPMTVKLLNAYADMDSQPYQGETIQASKREIEDTLDTLNQAFEKLLDSVFADTALDVSSDISVLHTLLAQEGLTEDELAKIKKQQNQS